MTVSTTASVATFLGNGITTTFTYSFIMGAATNAVVTYVDTAGSATVLGPSQYTLTINAAATGQLWGVGGTITYPISGSPIPDGASLTLGRIVPFKQDVSIRDQGAFYAQAVELALDNLEMQIQQIADQTLNPSTDVSNDTVVSTGSTMPRTLADRFQNPFNVKDYGAIGDGVTDDTDAIQAAFDAAAAYGSTSSVNGEGHVVVYFPAGAYLVRESATGSGYCILNEGCSVIGDSVTASIIYPYGTVANTVDFMRVTPPTNLTIDGLEFKDFTIHPATLGSFSTSKQGRYGVFVNITTTSNGGQVFFEHFNVTPGNNYSVYFFTTYAANIQGIPANSLFQLCSFWEGVRFDGAGDSITLRNCVLRSSASSGRRGVLFTSIDDGAGGTSGNLVLDSNNADCDGGFLLMLGGACPTITNNNIEMSHGSGTTSGAVIEIAAATTTIGWAKIEHNMLAIFGTSTASQFIKLNDTAGAIIDNNRILAGFTVGNGIYVDTNCTNTYLGFNEISSAITAPFTDVGIGTRGISKAVTPQNSFTNTVSYQPLSCMKSKDGQIMVSGNLDCPANPNGKVVGTLPTGFRPSTNQSVPIGAVVSGAQAPQELVVNSSGTMTYVGNDTATTISFSFVFPTLAYVVGDD